VRVARQGRKPEARFRFAGPCHRNGCIQWTGEGCGVADAILYQIANVGVPLPEALPRWSIRPACRWFHQGGAAACRACRFVITDVDPLPPAQAAARSPRVAGSKRDNEID
jgi:hypothetical protein